MKLNPRRRHRPACLVRWLSSVRFTMRLVRRPQLGTGDIRQTRKHRHYPVRLCHQSQTGPGDTGYVDELALEHGSLAPAAMQVPSVPRSGRVSTLESTRLCQRLNNTEPRHKAGRSRFNSALAILRICCSHMKSYRACPVVFIG